MKNYNDAKGNWYDWVKACEEDFEYEKASNLIELSKNLYEENLKWYANKYLNYLMSDNYFWYEDAPKDEENRSKEIANFLLGNDLWDMEEGLRQNDEYYDYLFWGTAGMPQWTATDPLII